MRKLAISLFAAASLLANRAALAQQADSARPVSLDEAVRLAQHNSPTTTQARGATHVARMGVTNALAQFLPNLGLQVQARHSAGAQYFQGKLVPFQGDPWSYNKGYGAGITLFDGGQRWFQYRASQATLNSDWENELLQRFNVALQVKQQYFAALAAHETEAAAERQLEAAETQVRVIDARFEAGAATRLDSLRSAVAVGQARLAIINAQNSLRTANATLTRLVGSAIPVTALASDTSDVPMLNVDSVALEKLSADGPAVRQASAAFSASRATRRASMTNYLPSLTMFYNSSTSKTTQVFQYDGSYPSNSKNYGFTLSFNVFNNFNRELTFAQASAAEDLAEANLRDARLAARENLANAIGTYRAAIQTIELQRSQIAAAEEDLRGQQDKFRLGVGTTLLDLSNAQAALDNARIALINARLQARTARAQIEALIGKELK